jgi:CheY-like chemotaxis protein
VNQTVLYIEDNQDNITLMERIFRRHRPHATLHVATNGRDGLSAARSEPPALILLDNRLPDLTGSQVLSQLISSQATAGIPVVLLSGDSETETVNKLLAAGATDYLAKPFDIHELMAIIDRHLPEPGPDMPARQELA